MPARRKTSTKKPAPRDEFKLEVEFTGLCLYVTNKARRRKNGLVTVLMPDCRRSFADHEHPDGSQGDPHVGYLRVNLANLIRGQKPEEEEELEGLRREAVYQFDGQVLDFGVRASRMNYKPLGLPSFKALVGIPPREELLAESPPADAGLLFRTKLRGGVLRGLRGNGDWKFKGVRARNAPHAGQFSEVITWTRPIKGKSLTLTLSKFDDSESLEIRLWPKNGVIKLLIANVCSTNPLEWSGLTTDVNATSDQDFKWLYHLFPLPRRKGRRLPVPVMEGFQALGAQGCLGGSYPE